MKTYNKLVRDLIPQIIEKDGKKCIVEKLNDADYIKKLNEKLIEECNEYLDSFDVEELADILEVIYAIAKVQGISIQELEDIRLNKSIKRGAFDEKLLLKNVL